MLVVEALTAGYDEVRVLRDVSLRVGSGELVAMVGANGAGKTTLLRAITGLVRPAAGAVRWDGRAITGLAPEVIAAVGIAHIPEGRGIFAGMTVHQNLKMGGYVHRLAAATFGERLEEVLALFPRLRDRLAQVAGTMSGGEQQMLAIARALIARPRMLVIDEPSHGLAPVVVAEVFARLVELCRAGTAVLVVEQLAAVALGAADRAYVLERGRVTFDGPAAILLEDRSRLSSAYLGAG